MARPRISQLIQAKYFSWRLRLRSGVWNADGRSNATNQGTHSLGTRDETEARKLLVELDLKCAVQQGRADTNAIVRGSGNSVSISEGRKLHDAHLARSRAMGGVKEVSRKRYRAVHDKFEEFTDSVGIESWDSLTNKTLLKYLSQLERDDYAVATMSFEASTIIQTSDWLQTEGHIARVEKLKNPITIPEGTNTYCWTDMEFKAIVNHCWQRKDLKWMAEIVTVLGYTGLRISELINLRWEDVDLKKKQIHVKDESGKVRRKDSDSQGRTTKSGRSRTVPINPELLPTLESIGRHRYGFVFLGPNGGRVKADRVRIVLLRDVLTPIADSNSGIPVIEDFIHGRLHSFRHFFCSMCANKRIAQPVLMKWLGHLDSDMVHHYYHLNDEESQRQMERIQLGLSTGTLPVDMGSVSLTVSTGKEDEKRD